MKITKEMGRAALRYMGDGQLTDLALDALAELGHGVSEADYFYYSDRPTEHKLTALAMCAAIAGVKPEDVL